MSSVFDQLRSTGRLPSPSGVGARILALTQDEDATVDDVASVLQRDPALTGRIMRVANSAQQAGAVALSTPKEAAMRLGMRSVSSIAVGFTLVNGYREGQCEAFDYTAYWSISVATAVAAQDIAKRIDREIAPEAFTAGLILRIGRLALASSQPRVYEGILGVWRGGLANLRELESDAFGINHAEVSEQLIQDWGMPRRVSHAIGSALCDPGLAQTSEALLLARILETAAYLACTHIGREPDDIQGDATLKAKLEQLGINPVEFTDDYPGLVQTWKEMSADMQIIPLPPIDENEEATSGESEAKEADTQPFVLVVDDDPISLKIISNCLTRSGYRVIATKDPKEALALAIQHEPAVLITDWQMPVMDGLALCRALRRCEAGRRLFIMVLTGREEESACIQAFDAEADDFIPKPFSPKDLISRVEVGMRLSQAQGNLEVQKIGLAGAESGLDNINDITAADRALGEESGRDVLTGLTNRVFATSRLSAYFERDVEKPLSVIALSIDGLATSGASASARDEITRRTADALLSVIRKDDTLCTSSTGGFLVLCPTCGMPDAVNVAERLRKAVEEEQISVEGFSSQVTISAGVAERNDSTPSAAALLQLAEAAVEFGAMDGPNQIHPAA